MAHVFRRGGPDDDVSDVLQVHKHLEPPEAHARPDGEKGAWLQSGIIGSTLPDRRTTLSGEQR